FHFREGLIKRAEHGGNHPEDHAAQHDGKGGLNHGDHAVHRIIHFAVIEEIDILQGFVHVAGIFAYLEHADNKVGKLAGDAQASRQRIALGHAALQGFDRSADNAVGHYVAGRLQRFEHVDAALKHDREEMSETRQLDFAHRVADHRQLEHEIIHAVGK